MSRDPCGDRWRPTSENPKINRPHQDQRLPAPPFAQAGQRLAVVGLAFLVALLRQQRDGELGFDEARAVGHSRGCRSDRPLQDSLRRGQHLYPTLSRPSGLARRGDTLAWPFCCPRRGPRVTSRKNSLCRSRLSAVTGFSVRAKRTAFRQPLPRPCRRDGGGVGHGKQPPTLFRREAEPVLTAVGISAGSASSTAQASSVSSLPSSRASGLSPRFQRPVVRPCFSADG